MDQLFVHAIEVKKEAGISEAKKIARKTLEKKRLYSYREGDDVYRFKNLPKKLFDKKTFRKLKLDDKVTLVCGRLKIEEQNVSQEEIENDSESSGTD